MKAFSPTFMLLQLAIVAVLLIGNFLWIRWFFGHLEPGAMAWAERSLGTELTRTILGSWTPVRGEGKLIHEFLAPGIQFGVMVGFLATLLAQGLLLYWLSVRYFGAWFE